MRKPVKKRGNSNATKVTTGSKHEAKHHREVMKVAVRVDYEAGILTRSQICDKYGFWQSTLTKYINAGDWKYASRREEALTTMHTRMIQKYADDRANISHQHLDELNNLKEKVLSARDSGELNIWSAKADTVMKIIRSERIALAMPKEYKYIEQKNENVYRVEDALKELNVQMHGEVQIFVDVRIQQPLIIRTMYMKMMEVVYLSLMVAPTLMLLTMMKLRM